VLLAIHLFYHLIAWQSKDINFEQVSSQKKVADIQAEGEHSIAEVVYKIEIFDMYFMVNSL
jgi:hypothetical protein